MSHATTPGSRELAAVRGAIGRPASPDDRPSAGRAVSAAIEAWRPVLDEVLGRRPLRVLDVGSGVGESAFLLHALGHYPHGVDVAPEMVRTARSAASARCAAVPFQVGDAEHLDFPAGVFDAVHVRELLATLPHPMWALAEWFRVLRPGGTLVIVEPTRAASPVADGLRSTEFLRSAGFEDIESRDLVMPRGCGDARAAGPWYRRWTAPSRRHCSIAWGHRA